MKVTEVRVVKLEKEDSNLKAYASVCFDGELVVDGYRVLEKDGELMVFMPRKVKTLEDGTITRRNTSYALNQELRSEIEEAVKAEYLK